MRGPMVGIVVVLLSGAIVPGAEGQTVRARVVVRTPEIAADVRYRDDYDGRRAREGRGEEEVYRHEDQAYRGSYCDRVYDKEGRKDCMEAEREYLKDLREAEREHAKAYREQVRESAKARREHVREVEKERREAEREYWKDRREQARERSKF